MKGPNLMATTIQTPVVTTTTETHYKCDHCDYKTTWLETCRKHEWENHHKGRTQTHETSAWGDDFVFRHFPDRESFDAFDAVFCAVSPDWEGPGWYKEYKYRDSCRGCDMGETTGLERIDDETSAQWITRDMVKRFEALEIMFALTLDCPPRFTVDGITWRRHFVRVPSDSISIEYATPDGIDPAPAVVIESWRVWKSER